MAFSTYEYSIEDGEPIELFRFVFNETEYFFTNGLEPYTDLLGNVWEPAPIKRGKLEDTNNEKAGKVKLEFPSTDSFVTKVQSEDSSSITVDVFKVHLNDLDKEQVLIWSGKVVDKRRSNYKYYIFAEPYINFLNRSGMRGHYQRICRYTLYKEGCYADPNINREQFQVLGQSGNILTLSGSPSTNIFQGGFVRILNTKQSRMILTYTGDALTLASGFTDISENDTVELFAGCNHSFTDCRDKFNNVENFGGFPWIPLKNPMGGTSIF